MRGALRFLERIETEVQRGGRALQPAYVEHWNDDPKPFMWHKTADEIIAKVRRGRATLAQVKSATHD